HGLRMASAAWLVTARRRRTRAGTTFANLRLQTHVAGLRSAHGIPTAAYTGLPAGNGRRSGLEVGNGGRLPAAGLGLAMCHRRQKRGEPGNQYPAARYVR